MSVCSNTAVRLHWKGGYNMLLKYTAAWFGMMVLAILNGAIRELLYKPYVGDLSAHQISTITLLVFFTVYLWILMSNWNIGSENQAWIIGSLWLIMTLIFEFGFGHFIAGNSWDKLLHDYNILAGRVWIFALIWILTAPYVLFRIRNSRSS